MLRLLIGEGSAKVRSGGPVDDADDLGLPVWAGEIPIRLVAGEPVADGSQTVRGLTAPEPVVRGDAPSAP